MCVCVCEREREREIESVCMFVWERDRECVHLCVCVCVRERESRTRAFVDSSIFCQLFELFQGWLTPILMKILFFSENSFSNKLSRYATTPFIHFYTQVVNFNNNLLAAFLYKSVLHSFNVLTVWLCNFLAKENHRKSCL